MAKKRRTPAWELVKSPKLFFLMVTTGVNATNFVFHVLFSRSLGPRTYSALGSLLALTVVASIPLAALQLASAQARASELGGVDARRLLTRVAIGAGVTFGVVAALAPALSRFLLLVSLSPVLLLGGWLALAVAASAAEGLLIGEQRFRQTGVAVFAGGGVVKLVAGAMSARLDLGLSGAVAAILLGQLVSLLIMLLGVRSMLSGGGTHLSLELHDGVRAAVALTGLAFYGSIDTFIARRYFAGASAGYYVAASTVGKIALFAPGAISLVMFPKFASQEGDKAALVRSFLVILGVGLGITAIFSIDAGLLARVLFGVTYQPAGSLIPYLAGAGCALGCLNLTTYFHLAARSTAAYLGWIGAMFVLVCGLTFRQAPRELALLLLISAAATASLSLVSARLSKALPSSLRSSYVEQ